MPGESHGGNTPSSQALDVLASPSKRRRNLVLRAGADGLLLPDDTAAAAQQEQESGTATQSGAESAPAAGTAGENGKQKVQPYTVCFVSTFFS